MGLPNLLDIVKANGSDALVGLIDEASKAAPEMKMAPSRPIAGISYKTLVRTALPGNTSGSFRSANAGSAGLKSVYENRLVETFIIEPRFECDKAVADAYIDGAPAYIAMEASGIMEAELQGLCKQFYYGTGTGGNAKGFPGLLQAYDATNMAIDAGGTTASTGSSVWLVKFGPKDVTWVWGNGGSFNLSQPRIESLIDPSDTATPPTKKLDGYVMTLVARPGLQVGSLRSLVRIKKLTEDNGKGLTDALINKALEKFPTGSQPDVIFMSRRSNRQLQSSRTATNPTGAPAPWPTSVVGIAGQNVPIVVTDSILDTEALTL